MPSLDMSSPLSRAAGGKERSCGDDVDVEDDEQSCFGDFMLRDRNRTPSALVSLPEDLIRRIFKTLYEDGAGAADVARCTLVCKVLMFPAYEQLCSTVTLLGSALQTMRMCRFAETRPGLYALARSLLVREDASVQYIIRRGKKPYPWLAFDEVVVRKTTFPCVWNWFAARPLIKPLVNVTELRLEGIADEADIMKSDAADEFGRVCRGITHLTLHKCYFRSPHTFAAFLYRFPKLESLTLSDTIVDRQLSVPPLQLPRFFLSLRSLCVDCPTIRHAYNSAISLYWALKQRGLRTLQFQLPPLHHTHKDQKIYMRKLLCDIGPKLHTIHIYPTSNYENTRPKGSQTILDSYKRAAEAISCSTAVLRMISFTIDSECATVPATITIMSSIVLSFIDAVEFKLEVLPDFALTLRDITRLGKYLLLRETMCRPDTITVDFWSRNSNLVELPFEELLDELEDGGCCCVIDDGTPDEDGVYALEMECDLAPVVVPVEGKTALLRIRARVWEDASEDDGWASAIMELKFLRRNAGRVKRRERFLLSRVVPRSWDNPGRAMPSTPFGTPRRQ